MLSRNIRCLIVFLLLPSMLFAQAETSAVSGVYQAAFDSAVSKLNRKQLAVYTGHEYYDYYLKEPPKEAGYWMTGLANRPGEHPFFLEGEFRKETIVFEDVVYPLINLSYDACRSEVVVLNPQNKPIVLPAGKVQQFDYAGHSFKRLEGVEGLQNDFYDMLFSSDSTMLVSKRRKNQAELWHTISDYYIILNNRAYPVSAINTKNVGMKATVLRILNDQEDQVRQYIRQNSLKFSKSQKESSLVKVVTYYASLKTK